MSKIHASLCDSRACNQTGGGSHLKSEIEDLLTLLPGQNNRVALTTCMGMCNRSPNMRMESNGRSVLVAQKSRLVSDGGLRMKLVIDGDDESRNEVETTATLLTDNVTIPTFTLEKVYHSINLPPTHEFALLAIQSKSCGNKLLLQHHFTEALHHFTLARSICDENSADSSNEIKSSIAVLHASICLSCVKTSVQCATELPYYDLKYEALKLAAVEAISVLKASVEVNIDVDTEFNTSVRDIISKLMQTDAGVELTTLAPNPKNIPKTIDPKIVIHLIVSLADALSNLSLSKSGEITVGKYTAAAVVGYKGVMEMHAIDVSSVNKRRILKVVERKRIERAVVLLGSGVGEGIEQGNS